MTFVVNLCSMSDVLCILYHIGNVCVVAQFYDSLSYYLFTSKIGRHRCQLRLS